MAVAATGSASVSGCSRLFSPDAFLLLCLQMCAGCFGTQRKNDLHTGVDLYCEMGTRVTACEDGIVVAINWFTGSNAPLDDGTPSDWWNDTKAILVEGESGVIVYGEVDPAHIIVSVGDKIKAGDVIGVVNVPVLKSFKGRPMVMLHIELLTQGSLNSPWWMEAESKPEFLLDPTPKLRECAPDGPVFNLSEYDGISYIDPSAPRKASDYWSIWGGER